MGIHSHSRSIALPLGAMMPTHRRCMMASSSLARAKRVRERILASLAFLMLIVAWDATLRLDERVAPPRMRVSHAVELGSVESFASPR